jgi:hypothetical protein
VLFRSSARRQAAAQLKRWGLADAVPTTELIVSELVTNAIRHASAPIELRLIHNGTLICEVSDASSTSPHPRRAHVLDEGGRGLLLVGRLSERWGTRHTGTGKTIWAEQPRPLRSAPVDVGASSGSRPRSEVIGAAPRQNSPPGEDSAGPVPAGTAP